MPMRAHNKPINLNRIDITVEQKHRYRGQVLWRDVFDT